MQQFKPRTVSTPFMELHHKKPHLELDPLYFQILLEDMLTQRITQEVNTSEKLPYSAQSKPPHKKESEGHNTQRQESPPRR